MDPDSRLPCPPVEALACFAAYFQPVSAFHKIIANVRSALERKPAPIPAHDAAAATPGTAQKIAAKIVVVGDGITLDAGAIGKALTRNAIDLIRPDRVRDDARAGLRDRIARSDLGVIEADYAIAATGTFCIVATAKRPSSITILPPVNFIVVAAERILPTLADVIAAVGPDQFARRRVALITGPSRTADIEKMIVIGVHGPKELYAAVITA